MIRYTVEAESAVEADVEAAFDWYEGELTSGSNGGAVSPRERTAA